MTYIPVQATLTVGGRVFTDLDNLITLHGCTNSQNFSTLRLPNGTSGYQVPVSKKLVIEAFEIIPSGSGTSVSCQLLYGDTDVGLDNGSAPTTPVYVSGGNDSGNRMFFANGAFGASGSNTQKMTGNTKFEVPASKYPATHSSTGAAFIVYGYLQDA